VALVVRLFAAGLLELKPLVTHRFPLEEHRAAFAMVEDRSAGALKVQLQP
jgi:L-iditol 2-dehydrogenase